MPDHLSSWCPGREECPRCKTAAFYFGDDIRYEPSHFYLKCPRCDHKMVEFSVPVYWQEWAIKKYNRSLVPWYKRIFA